MLADLFRLHGVDATMIGGTRSTAGVAQSAQPPSTTFRVDAERSRTYGQFSRAYIRLDHRARRSAAFAVRRNAAAGRWAGQQSEQVEWPADVPTGENTASQFEIATDGAARATVTFRAMPSTVATGPATVATGILLGLHFHDLPDRLTAPVRADPPARPGASEFNRARASRPTYQHRSRPTLTVKG